MTPVITDESDRLTELARAASENTQLLKDLFADPAFRNRARIISKSIFRRFHSAGGYRDAEDLEQDLYQRVLESIGTFKSRNSLSAWLHRIASNIEIDQLRRKNSHADSIVECIWLSRSSVEDETFADQINRKVILQRALSNLSSQERDIVLAWCSGKTYEEIGQQLGLSKSEIHRKLIKATERMHAYVKEPRNE